MGILIHPQHTFDAHPAPSAPQIFQPAQSNTLLQVAAAGALLLAAPAIMRQALPSRRSFIRAAGATTVALLATPAIAQQRQQQPVRGAAPAQRPAAPATTTPQPAPTIALDSTTTFNAGAASLLKASFEHALKTDPQANAVTAPGIDLVAGAQGWLALRDSASVQGMQRFFGASANANPEAITAAIFRPVMQVLTYADPQTDAALKIKVQGDSQIWIDNSLAVNPAYIASYRRALAGGTDPERVDFSINNVAATQRINDWASSATENVIRSLFARPLMQSTQYVAGSALSFVAPWTLPFNPLNTETAIFGTNGLQVLMMNSRRPMNVAMVRNDSFEAIALPYGSNDDFVFTVIKPTDNSPANLGRFIARASEIDAALIAAPKGNVIVQIPRIRLSADENMVDALSASAIGPAFASNADYSGMANGVRPMSFLVHKIEVEIDESGTRVRGAAASGTTRGLMPGVPTFRWDQPGICAVVHRPTGTALMRAVVQKPQPLTA